MQVLLDNAIAIFISSTILLMLVQVYHSGQEASVDAARQYAGRVNNLALVEVLQRDMTNIGAGRDADEAMVVDYDWAGADKFFEFYAIVDTSDAAAVERLRYELVETKKVAITVGGQPDSVQAYELRRFVHDGTDFVPNGKSIDSVVQFTLGLYDGAGTQIGSGGDFDTVREVSIEMVSVSPFGEEDMVGRSYWQTRFRPTNLTRKDE